MRLEDRIQKDLVQAMKTKQAERMSVLRMMKTALKNREIEKRSPLDEAENVQVLQTMLKQRAEAIEQFEAGGRTDLAEKERREKQVIASYLPEALSVDAMEEIVTAVMEETAAAGPKDVGKVMKEAMARLRATGKMVDGKAVNALVRDKLEALAAE